MSSTDKPYVIVVGIDYSATSDLALEQAFDLAAARSQADVHVVHVLRLYGAQAGVEIAGATGEAPRLSLAEATAELGRYVDQRWTAFLNQHDRPAPSGSGRVLSHLRLDAPAEEIAQIAADLEADLVVVGTHGRRGIARWLLGSVAEAVVRLAPCPVFVVRPKALPDQGPRIEPPCPRCLEARRASAGAESWCEQHRQRHGQRHTYSQNDRVGVETEMPLIYRS